MVPSINPRNDSKPWRVDIRLPIKDKVSPSFDLRAGGRRRRELTTGTLPCRRLRFGLLNATNRANARRACRSNVCAPHRKRAEPHCRRRKRRLHAMDSCRQQHTPAVEAKACTICTESHVTREVRTGVVSVSVYFTLPTTPQCTEVRSLPEFLDRAGANNGRRHGSSWVDLELLEACNGFEGRAHTAETGSALRCIACAPRHDFGLFAVRSGALAERRNTVNAATVNSWTLRHPL
jgi:hypothetical protein